MVPILLVAMSCQILLTPADSILVGKTLREDAFDHALTWKSVPYLYDGQSRQGVDCSGLAVEAYVYATQDTPVGLPFYDANVCDFMWFHTIQIEIPEKGDLIFMGEAEITHIALFKKIEKNLIYFVGAFEGNEAVSYRLCTVDDLKIHYFGRLLVAERK